MVRRRMVAAGVLAALVGGTCFFVRTVDVQGVRPAPESQNALAWSSAAAAMPIDFALPGPHGTPGSDPVLQPTDHLVGAVRTERARLVPPIACFAPGTPDEVMEAFIENFWDGIDPSVAYQLFCRWPGSQGSGKNLSWSFAPDGLFIPSGTGEPGGNNEIFNRMDALFGGNRALWILRFQQCFDRWQQLTGNVYTRVTDGANDWDDGAAWGADGDTNRGDCRIAMKNIDGGSGILGYNHFPPCSGFQFPGDMVLDRSEAWQQSFGSHRFLRNVVMHEHGHGIGLLHVCPANGTKLMEPFAGTNFDGPQHDDIRGGHRFYGDPFEFDNGFPTANDLGTIVEGSPVTFGSVPSPAVSFSSILSLDNSGEEDWFKFTILEGQDVTIAAIPRGLSYDSSTQNGNGSCNSGNIISSLLMADLGISLYDTDGTTLLATADTAPIGQTETLVWQLLVPDTYYFRVFPETAVVESQLYLLQVSVGVPDPCFGVICDDGNVCTDDTCVDGDCVFDPNTEPCGDDGEQCTDDVCSGGNCTHPNLPNGTDCDDGLFCTPTDACQAGTCVGSGDACPSPAEVCDEEVDSCVPAPGACCLGDGTCVEVSQNDCLITAGFYYGSGVACEDPLDPPCVPADTAIHCQIVGNPCVQPGETVDVEFFIEQVSGLFTYQVIPQSTLLAGSGTLDLDCDLCTGDPNEPDCPTRVDGDRTDYIFSGLNSLEAVDCPTERVGATLFSGGGSAGAVPEYLGDYTFTVAGDTTVGTQFEVAVDVNPANTFFDNTGGVPIRFRRGSSCFVTVPDGTQCVAPQVVAEGCRTLLVTPQCSTLPQALLVTGDSEDSEVACVSAYVQDPAGTLGPNPVFLAPDQWGTAPVHGAEIFPLKTYTVQADCGSPGNPDLSPPASATTWDWGDVKAPPDDDANFLDISLVVKAFQSDFSEVTRERADLHPCTPNRDVNFFDISWAVRAFQGTPLTAFCPLPCP